MFKTKKFNIDKNTSIWKSIACSLLWCIMVTVPSTIFIYLHYVDSTLFWRCFVIYLLSGLVNSLAGTLFEMLTKEDDSND